MKALVTGGTGFVGPRLLRLLNKPTVLTRNPERAAEKIGHLAGSVIGWNPIEGPPPPDSFDGVDCVFHLAGESVAEGRWTTSQKAKIRDSRILGTKNLVSGILQNKTSVKKLISSSAVGFYGDRGEEELTESSPPGNDFLADVCIGWEREADIAREQGIRVVTMRTGIVLGAGGGALAKMLTPFRLGAGGPLGNGRQWMPWIHVADLARLYVHANENSLLDGPMNAVAPNPVRNSEFTKALATQLKRPAFMPAPYLGLRLVFGEFAKVLFASQKVVPQIALETGFGYQFPFLKEALEDILSV
jgi:uncharacterized protein (TIGR01777 family)